MKSKLIYVELKTGYNDNGPAWIGYGVFNRTGKTIYFNGQVFGTGQGIAGNHFHIDTGNEYWISGVKKNGKDRLYGNAIVSIDKDAVEDYLKMRGINELPKGLFSIVTLDKTIAKDYHNEIQNKPL
jgi:hypothetical protein